MTSTSSGRSLLSKASRLLSVALCVALAACQSTELTSAGLSSSTRPYPPLVGQPEVRAPATYVVDATNGATLFAENADALRYPASLTKMMTLYLLFEAIASGRASLDGDLLISENAASKPPSKLGAKAGTRLRVRDAIQAVAVRSANDVATAIAENLGGSEQAFAVRMTAKARQLGMMRTQFVNPSGLPDPRQISTAHDMAILARALRSRFPQFLPFFSVTSFQYGGRTFKATNKLLGRVEGVDGMKTGYIRDSGFHLVASARRGGRSIIVVVMGGVTGRARDAYATQLIDRYLGGTVTAASPMAAPLLPGDETETF
ncbi:D-alanyl-D-alanine carboxypeptidase family protein [Mangrovicella endophytica]|uniref:D-alanyl-D-alanine carboxypeptidase family protein n=1 Tax=Mangrovicella endophytica TaxID=2066697 RepID=UPI000C9E5AE7|nr:D-alanyl-D-alanine carboxypeptidase family protein [Mangrovicella endophytica]